MKVNKVKGIKCYIKNRLPSKVQMFNFRGDQSCWFPQIRPCPSPIFYLLPSILEIGPPCPGCHNFLTLTKNGMIIAITSHIWDEKLKLSNFMARSWSYEVAYHSKAILRNSNFSTPRLSEICNLKYTEYLILNTFNFFPIIY